MAKLHLLPETPDAEPFEIIETMLLIGRKPDNTLQVEDNNVSKYHALLVKTEEGYRLYDLHSANGTYVNDQRVTATILKNNDQLRVGPAVFRFEAEPIQPAMPSPLMQPKIRFAGRPGSGPLGRKPILAPTAITPPAPPPPTPPPPTPVPIAVASLVPEPETPPAVVPTTATLAQAVPVAETAPPATPVPIEPAKKEEPRVSIRIPENKKSLISQSLAPSDAKETQPTSPVAKSVEPERPKLRFGFAPKPPAEPPPAPKPVPEEPVPTVAKPATEPTPAPAPAPEQPVQPPATTLAGPKPPGTERSLRPKLGGTGSGEMKLKTFKK